MGIRASRQKSADITCPPNKDKKLKRKKSKKETVATNGSTNVEDVSLQQKGEDAIIPVAETEKPIEETKSTEQIDSNGIKSETGSEDKPNEETKEVTPVEAVVPEVSKQEENIVATTLIENKENAEEIVTKVVVTKETEVVIAKEPKEETVEPIKAVSEELPAKKEVELVATEIKLEAEPETKVEAVKEFAIELETKPEVEQEAKIVALPESKVEVVSETKVEVVPEAKVEVVSETKVEVVPEAKVEDVPEAKVEVVTAPKVLTEAKVEAVPEPEVVPEVVAVPEPKVEAVSEAKIEIVPETKIEVVLEDKVEIAPEVKVEIVPETKIEVIPEAKVEHAVKEFQPEVANSTEVLDNLKESEDNKTVIEVREDNVTIVEVGASPVVKIEETLVAERNGHATPESEDLVEPIKDQIPIKVIEATPSPEEPKEIVPNKNSVQVNESEDKKEEKVAKTTNVSITFGWSDGGKEVAVAGTFNDWADPWNLLEQDGSWVLTSKLGAGLHHYKYLVDGEWKVNQDLPVADLEEHGKVNVLDVKATEE